MPTLEQARALAGAWIAAWNAHDLEAILAHYAEAVQFSSPRVVELAGQADGALHGTLHGKAALRAYFAQGLATQPALRFALLDCLTGPDGCTLYYRNHRGQTAAETLWLDAAGRVARACVHYAPQAAPPAAPQTAPRAAPEAGPQQAPAPTPEPAPAVGVPLTPTGLRNLLAEFPPECTREVFQVLLETPTARLERIVSHGQATPAGQWYDQDGGEWVALLAGSAGLRLAHEPQPRTLQPGDCLYLPPHARHRVEWTAADEPTVWLALHLR